MADVGKGPMSDEGSASEEVGADRAAEPRFFWSAPPVAESRQAETAAVLAEDAEPDEGVEDEEVVQRGARARPHRPHELTDDDGDAQGAFSDDPREAPSSDRALELETAYWRERAIVWRERGMAAERLAKVLERNVDDLRAHLEDLRSSSSAPAPDVQRTAAIASPDTPWRRALRDVYDKYLG